MKRIVEEGDGAGRGGGQRVPLGKITFTLNPQHCQVQYLTLNKDKPPLAEGKTQITYRYYFINVFAHFK